MNKIPGREFILYQVKVKFGFCTVYIESKHLSKPDIDILEKTLTKIVSPNFYLTKKFYNSFIVLPKHCNYMYPLIFGGALIAELNLCAAALTNKVIRSAESVCDNAVTYKADFTFLKPSYIGDLITMEAQLEKAKGKHLVVNVTAAREDRKTLLTEKIAEAKFVFVTRIAEAYKQHGINYNITSINADNI